MLKKMYSFERRTVMRHTCKVLFNLLLTFKRLANNCIWIQQKYFLVFQSSPVCSRLGLLKSDLRVNVNNMFKLGQEGKYRAYQNQYSTNVLALNKHQHREDHDKRRHLSHKFSLTTASEFKWNGSIYGSRSLTVATLRLTIVQLETNIPGPFMHPNWASHR